MKTLTAATLEGLPGLAHGFFTRRGGVSQGIYGSLNAGPGSGDDPAAVAENRERVARALGAAHLVTVHQHHSADVVRVDGPFTGPRPKADAMVTDRPGLALGVLSADCGPLLMADPEAGVIGAAHAGWGGALKGIIGNTIDAMETLGADRARIRVALGPALAQPSYEVGPEYRARFVADDPRNERFFSQPDGAPRPFFDLPGYIAARVMATGVAPAHFADLARDTYAEPGLFYSYRRSVHHGEPDYGRLVAAVMLTP
ncbi:peptidoglycan editing factor PgeF [Minwuia thermotolerans]|uniref:Purine nucleoside phosphorylase n=1 Tax=Minwuia thermotolerans TaxID=2056226 RepID=A0A2M9G2N8_9PROT|nr:peptidoglycan editing factor PgeF [Minwuia thermotolerans]PJK29987.1 peptidoglycan editing factor PgeF [Minwuia thermotolerans]